MIQHNPDEAIDESLEIEELSDGDLEEIAGGRGHHGRMRHRRRGRHASHSSFSKRSLSISGQTITKPDGTSITSFSMQLEEITSQVSELTDTH